jgi:hypothetical protein
VKTNKNHFGGSNVGVVGKFHLFLSLFQTFFHLRNPKLLDEKMLTSEFKVDVSHIRRSPDQKEMLFSQWILSTGGLKTQFDNPH